MLTDRLETFTDRADALALFDELRSRDPNKPWPLLPILAFIAPGGSGKSTLIEHLIEEKCSLAGRPVLPYARLDFLRTRVFPKMICCRSWWHYVTSYSSGTTATASI